MDNKHNSDISADELLAQLKANMADGNTDEKSVTGKKYKFRRSGKITASVSEEDIKAHMPDNSDYSFESPVPKSDIEDLDIDELMKKYLPEEDYRRMTEKAESAEIEEEFVQTLSSIDIPEEMTEGSTAEPDIEDAKTFTAPDEDLYNRLSAGGKVCDVPELDGVDSYDSMADTMQAPLRPMTDIEKTIAYVSDDEEGGFMSVREILAAQNAPAPEEEEVSAPSADTVAVNLSNTVEIAFNIEETDAEENDTLTFTAINDAIISTEDNAEDEDEFDDIIVTSHSSEESFEKVEEIEEKEEEPKRDTDISALEEIFSDDDLSLDESVFDDVYGAPAVEEPKHGGYDEEPEEELEEAIEEAEEVVEEAEEAEEVVEEAEEADELTELDEIEEYDSLEELEALDEVTEEESIDAVTEEETEAAPDEDLFNEVAEEEALVPTEIDKYSEFADEINEDGFDEVDANLMVAFGMDEELDAAIGKESADKLRSSADELITDEVPVKEKVKPEEVKEPIKEFVSPTEIKGIFENYKAEYGKSAIKLFILAAISIVLFFYENISIFGAKPLDVFNPEYYPVVHIMAGFQLIIIGFAVLYKEVIFGFKNLINRRVTVESILPIMLAVSALYSVIACFFGAGSTIVGFNFPMAIALLLFAFGKRLDLRREIMTFRIISSKRSKFALEKLDIIDAELETKAFDKFLPSQPDIFRINKTAFIDGYFRRTGEYSSVKNILNAFIPATVIAFVVGIIVGAFVNKDFPTAMSTGYAAFAFALPMTAFFAFSLPMFRASKVSYDDGSAIVGEGALDEYTSASSISFDDREVFPTAGVKLRSIKVFGSGRLDTAIYYMASVYSCIGGPLSDVLNVATADIGRSQNIEVISIDADGIETVVDGHHIYAGKADYLRHNGYLPVTDPEDEEIEGGEISILFLVCDDEVVAKFYVRYRIDPEFEATLKNLYKSGICVGIKTVDPNINDEMLSTRIRLTKYPVRVLKYDDLGDRSRGTDRTDSGIVSKKSVKALLRAFTLCDKTKHVTKTNLMIATLSIIGGIAITAIVAFLGSIAAISSVYVALYQLFWLASVYLISRFLLM
ncbi:MAG: hypothetical protein E7648_01495 [Ruminococcaceae bacterium]|nr:hypothetical protein [Oscillospiraceae bacterium]